MEPVLFFLLGLPMVYVANRLVVQLTAFDEDSEGENARVLPWQQGAWPGRVRWGVLLMLPPSMAVAGARFEFIPAIGVSLLLAGLLICTATDLLRFRVPNLVTYPGIVLALLAAVIMPDGHLASAFLAALLGGVLFLILAIFSRGGLGLGDVKLAVLIGAALGLPAAYQALFIGVIAGGVVILGMFVAGIVSRRQPVPYAPFLALSAAAVLLVQGPAFAPLS